MVPWRRETRAHRCGGRWATLAIAALATASPVELRAQQRERGLLTIFVTDTRDEAIADARLTVRGSDSETPVSSDRDIKIATQRDGTQFLRVTAEGYLPAAFGIHIPDDRHYEIHVQLERPGRGRANAPRARRVWMNPVGQEPSKLLLGDGEIVDDSLIVAWRANTMSDVMRHVFGIDARHRAGQSVLALGRPTKSGSLCAVAFFLDGIHLTTIDILEGQYGLQEFELVEVFRVGTAVPTAYRRLESRCGAVIAWTKRRS